MHLEKLQIVDFGDSDGLLRKSNHMSDYYLASRNRSTHSIAHLNKISDSFSIELALEKPVSTKFQFGFYPEYDFPLSSIPDLLPFALNHSNFSQKLVIPPY